MARPLRLEFPGALYHVTARGNAQQSIFLDDTDRTHFLTLLGRESQQQRWGCYAYCVMGNHYHLVVETPEPNLSRGLRRLHGTYTLWFNRRHRRVGHVLQGRFKSLLVEKDAYLQELCRYVVLNPVRAGMVRAAKDHAWSSYRATAGAGAAPDWLAVHEVLELFDRKPTVARAAYRQFVAEGMGQPSPWRQVTGQIYLGGPAFLARMQQLLRGRSKTNVPVAHTHPLRPSSDAVLAQVAAAYRVPLGALLDRSHREGYQTAVYLLRRAANDPLQTVAIRRKDGVRSCNPTCLEPGTRIDAIAMELRDARHARSPCPRASRCSGRALRRDSPRLCSGLAGRALRRGSGQARIETNKGRWVLQGNRKRTGSLC